MRAKCLTRTRDTQAGAPESAVAAMTAVTAGVARTAKDAGTISGVIPTDAVDAKNNSRSVLYFFVKLP